MVSVMCIVVVGVTRLKWWRGSNIEFAGVVFVSGYSVLGRNHGEVDSIQ